MENLIYQTNQKYITPIHKPQTFQVHEMLLCGVVGFFSAFGSGSTLSSVQKERGSYRYIIPSREDNSSDSINAIDIDIKSISEQLNNIKVSLKINISNLAELLDVSRPSVYAWLKGENPNSDEVINKIKAIEIVAAKIDALKLERVDNMLKRPLFDGTSILSLMKQNLPISDSHLAALKELDSKEAKVRVNSSASKNVRSFRDAIEDVATPLWL